MEKGKLSWRFPGTFWGANVIELFERAAYYGAFIAMALYLTRSVGFTDIETGWIVGLFAAFLYFMPTFMGALADEIGFRKALIMAFILLTAGYFLLGFSQAKPMAIFSLVLILLGGAIVKPVIAATVSKCSDPVNRARAFSIFYQAINIGSFSGKMFAKPLRVHLGLEYINYYAASMAFVALILTLLFFKNIDDNRTGKKFKEAVNGLIHVVKDVRFIIFLIIIGGFWAIQGQMYATMPKYVLRLLGEGASPEWLANVNPFVVVICVLPVTYFVRKIKPISSMLIAMVIMPFSALAIAFSPVLESMFGESIHVIGSIFMHPLTIMMIVGIGMQGLAECFLSPRFYEYISKQAPKHEIGLYMGYSNLKSFFSWIFGFVLSGYLLNAYCPNPKTLTDGEALTAYDCAHYIWYIYAGIAFISFFALIIFNYITKKIDEKKKESG